MAQLNLIYKIVQKFSGLVQFVMPQSSINNFSTIPMPKQITQQSQMAWVKLRNHKYAMVALQKVTVGQKAMCTIEKQCTNNAHHSREYHIMHNSRWHMRENRGPTDGLTS